MTPSMVLHTRLFRWSDDTEHTRRVIDRIFKAECTVIVPQTVREILDGQIARKLA